MKAQSRRTFFILNRLKSRVPLWLLMRRGSSFESASESQNLRIDVELLCTTGKLKEALELVRQANIKADCATYAVCLRTCGNLKTLSEVRTVHRLVDKGRFRRNTFLGNLLVDIYGKCGSLDEAVAVFEKIPKPNVYSWNAVMAAYVQHGQVKRARDLFRQMQREGFKPDSCTFSIILSTCIGPQALETGKMIHQYLIDTGIQTDVFVGASLINMYGKCGSVEDAWTVFEKMSQKDDVTWNTMITAFAQNGQAKQALQLFHQMNDAGIRANKITFVSVLDACAGLSALGIGRAVHRSIIQREFESDVVVGTALINMYGKSGNLEDAHKAFNKICNRDAVSWTAMIASYAHNGHAEEVLNLYEQMCVEGVKPDRVTFVHVLSVCSHSGLQFEGRHYFVSLPGDYKMAPTVEHYGCMVDLLGRSGELVVAEELVNNMVVEPDAMVWTALLGTCRVHGDAERAKRAAGHVHRLDPSNAAPYVLLSNIHSLAGRWEEAVKVRRQMEERGIKKQPGISWIEMGNKMHEFYAADKVHPQTEEIYAELHRLMAQLKEIGYVPHIESVLHNVEEEKENLLCFHSEKLAIVFGLLNTPPGESLRIIKNLRICSDCHLAARFISKLVDREIILRDTTRFHHFKNGTCSCRDYW